MAAVTNVQLMGTWSSPFAMRPRIALNLKNIDYEYLEENYANKSALLLKSNPIHKKVPVMIHNDQPICESLVILQYIDEVFTSGPSLLPSDPYDRAIAHFWSTYIDNTWFSSVLGIAKALTEEEKATTSEGITAGLALLEEAFEKISKGKGFFGGETIGYVDIALGSCLGWIRVAETLSGSNFLNETTTPGLYAWVDRFSSNDAVKDLIPDTQKLVGFSKWYWLSVGAQPSEPFRRILSSAGVLPPIYPLTGCFLTPAKSTDVDQSNDIGCDDDDANVDAQNALNLGTDSSLWCNIGVQFPEADIN
ncbi:Glutathione s-transferase u18 [Thalictrum thalictroides]|uniref:glutathione transferase n=1 Tax=Thalictrum thalictroides TaxID=46969 RepID=A0A7J6VI57_THATH|nr:Glutathione s-transferase u18 [Thalictrum thalictroides]